MATTRLRPCRQHCAGDAWLCCGDLQSPITLWPTAFIDVIERTPLSCESSKHNRAKSTPTTLVVVAQTLTRQLRPLLAAMVVISVGSLRGRMPQEAVPCSPGLPVTADASTGEHSHRFPLHPIVNVQLGNVQTAQSTWVYSLVNVAIQPDVWRLLRSHT